MNILWDFDGTIFDTYPVYTKIMKQIIERDIPEEVIYDRLKISFGEAFQSFAFTEAQEKLFIAKAGQVSAGDFKPYEGVEGVLAAANLNVIMTHNHREFVLNALRHHGLENYFIDMVTSEDGFPRKPDPASYEYLNRRYSINLAIGDRLIDIIPAEKIGIKTCLFQNRERGADFYLNHYRDFFDAVHLE
ncbi:HAD family hydrolase [Sporolactobacillus sp. THM7-4]|nr:HAD family hydrolase [Sporolactobacillus sp. THM7-4]